MSNLLWSFVLLAAAVGVIGLEMFVPSAGLLALLAGTLLVSSVIMAFTHSLLAGVSMIIAILMLLKIL